MATNYPNAAKMFDAPMRVIFNVAVGGGFSGIGNRAPDMSTWDKPTMEIDYIRTWDDETVPDAPCMDTVVCDASTCASCDDRVDWLMENRGMTMTEARQEVADEFPDQCNCDSDCMSNVACKGSSCYTCRERVEWLEANEGMTQDQAEQRIEQEFPVECSCEANTVFPAEVGTTAAFSVDLDEVDGDTESTSKRHLPWIEILAGAGAILLCFGLITFCSRYSDKDEADNIIQDGTVHVKPEEDSTDVILTEIFENEM